MRRSLCARFPNASFSFYLSLAFYRFSVFICVIYLSVACVCFTIIYSFINIKKNLLWHAWISLIADCVSFSFLLSFRLCRRRLFSPGAEAFYALHSLFSTHLLPPLSGVSKSSFVYSGTRYIKGVVKKA